MQCSLSDRQDSSEVLCNVVFSVSLLNVSHRHWEGVDSERAAEHLGQQVVAGLKQGEQGRGDGSHARADGNCGLSTLQSRHFCRQRL